MPVSSIMVGRKGEGGRSWNKFYVMLREVDLHGINSNICTPVSTNSLLYAFPKFRDMVHTKSMSHTM